MWNPVRFIDLGLGFSPVEKSLIKVTKQFFPCLCLIDLKADSTTAGASFNAVASSPSQASKIALILNRDCKRQTLLFLIIPFLLKETSWKVYLAASSLYYGGRKSLMNCVLHGTLQNSFQKSASTTERVWSRSWVLLRALKCCCLLLGEWDQRQRIWCPEWVFKSKQLPQTICCCLSI